MSKPCEPFGDHESVLFADLVLALDETRENIRLEPALNAVHRYRDALIDELLDIVSALPRTKHNLIDAFHRQGFEEARLAVLHMLRSTKKET